MLVSPAVAADAVRVAELAKLSGSGVDVGSELERAWAKLWVARPLPEARAVGFVLAWYAADEVHLLDLAVEPEARRLGVGRLLVEVLVGDARERCASRVLLEVRRSNGAALALYQSAGFCACGVRHAYYSDNGEDAILMRLELVPPKGSKETP